MSRILKQRSSEEETEEANEAEQTYVEGRGRGRGEANCLLGGIFSGFKVQMGFIA